MKEKAQAIIDEESRRFQIYSYRAFELQHEVVDQCNIVETCLKIINNEAQIPYKEIIRLRKTLFKKREKPLYYKFGDKFKAARAWLARYLDIEENSKRIWGQLKTVSG